MWAMTRVIGRLVLALLTAGGTQLVVFVFAAGGVADGPAFALSWAGFAAGFWSGWTSALPAPVELVH